MRKNKVIDEVLCELDRAKLEKIIKDLVNIVTKETKGCDKLIRDLLADYGLIRKSFDHKKLLVFLGLISMLIVGIYCFFEKKK
jgi:hypothetical protein